MASFPPSMLKLIRELSRLPSIGEKTASRLAYHLVSGERELARTLAEALGEAAGKICFCEKCFFLSEEKICSICSNANRDAALVCVVEKPMDVIAIERMGEYRGVYHVLHGLWAPLRGRGLEGIKLAELNKRIAEGGVREVIIATGSTVEGDATALYIARLVSELGVKTSRLAQGMPRGGELEYADDITLSRAISGRSVLTG